MLGIRCSQRFECKFTNNQFVRRRGERKWIGPGDGTPFPTRNPAGRNNEKRSYWPCTARYATGPTVSRNKLAEPALPNFLPLSWSLTTSSARLHEQKGVTCRDAFARARQAENLPISLSGEKMADDRDGRTILFGSRRSLEPEDSVASPRSRVSCRLIGKGSERVNGGATMRLKREISIGDVRVKSMQAFICTKNYLEW